MQTEKPQSPSGLLTPTIGHAKDNAMKTCTRCKETKPLSEFHKSSESKDGHGIYCRSCKSPMKREALAKDGDKIREQKRASHHRHKEKNNERTRKWTEENKNRLSIQRRHRYATDEEYREDKKRQALLWPKQNPAAFKASQKRRDERMKAIGGDISKELKIEIWLDQEERCAYCGITLQFHECETDHLLAVSRGGTNERDNLRVACETCNCSKGTKTLEEWQAVRGW